MTFLRCHLLVAACVVWACTPALDWREVVLEGTPVRAMLPCRPSVFSRSVTLSEHPVQWTILSCRTAGAQWSVGYGSAPDPTASARLLQALSAMPQGGTQGERVPWRAEGFPMRPEVGRWRWTQPDGQGGVLSGDAVVAMHGPHLVRLVVTAPHLDAEAVTFFVDSLSLR